MNPSYTHKTGSYCLLGQVSSSGFSRSRLIFTQRCPLSSKVQRMFSPFKKTFKAETWTAISAFQCKAEENGAWLEFRSLWPTKLDFYLLVYPGIVNHSQIKSSSQSCFKSSDKNILVNVSNAKTYPAMEIRNPLYRQCTEKKNNLNAD